MRAADYSRRANMCEFRTAEYPGDLPLYRRGECEYIHFLGPKQRVLGGAVHLERSTDQGGSVENDQLGVSRSRRSAL